MFLKYTEHSNLFRKHCSFNCSFVDISVIFSIFTCHLRRGKIRCSHFTEIPCGEPRKYLDITQWTRQLFKKSFLRRILCVIISAWLLICVSQLIIALRWETVVACRWHFRGVTSWYFFLVGVFPFRLELLERKNVSSLFVWTYFLVVGNRATFGLVFRLNFFSCSW